MGSPVYPMADRRRQKWYAERDNWLDQVNAALGPPEQSKRYYFILIIKTLAWLLSNARPPE
jgi:hypothetical protein